MLPKRGLEIKKILWIEIFMSILTHHLIAGNFSSKISIESWFPFFTTKLPHTGQKKRKSFQRRKLFRQRGITKIKKRPGREQSIKLLH